MPEHTKSILRRFYDEVNAGNLGVIDELLADDMVEQEKFPGLEPTKEGVKQVFAAFRSGFPDVHIELHEILAEGDLACARITWTGTHQGEFMGIPPSGKRIEMDSIDMIRVNNGQVIEHWGITDSMTMMQQLGVTQEQPPG